MTNSDDQALRCARAPGILHQQLRPRGNGAPRAAAICLALAAFLSLCEGAPAHHEAASSVASPDLAVAQMAGTAPGFETLGNGANAGPGRFVRVADASRPAHAQPSIPSPIAEVNAVAGEDEAVASPGMMVAGLLIVGLIAVRRMAG